jgi:hypothetical protein
VGSNRFVSPHEVFVPHVVGEAPHYVGTGIGEAEGKAVANF